MSRDLAQAARALADWLDATGPVAVLTGAGLSTESGIPDYRGPTGAARPATPMTLQVFTGSEAAQQRYWARSQVGWRTIALAEPNDGHRAVSELTRQGRLAGTITQNVDGLHRAAGLGRAIEPGDPDGLAAAIELHGNLDHVVCLRCGERSSREALDVRLQEANPHWQARVLAVKPDGDVELADSDVTSFHVVACQVCAGTLKPDVVFFGETVPADRVAASFALVESAAGLLVLGSSLRVMSGYRFVLRAGTLGLPVAIVNQGPTRGDTRSDLRLDAPLGQLLTRVAEPTYGAVF